MKEVKFMQFDELINRHRENLNDTDMAILKHILQNKKEVKHISIHTLAKNWAVSSTAIVRFSQKLGFDGFGELKAFLKMENSSAETSSGDLLKNLQNFYSQTAEKIFKWNFDDANKLIRRSNRVFAFASGYVQSNVVQEIKRLFFFIFKTFFYKKRDLCLYFCPLSLILYCPTTSFKKFSLARLTLPCLNTSILSILGELTGNVLSTPTP